MERPPRPPDVTTAEALVPLGLSTPTRHRSLRHAPAKEPQSFNSPLLHAFTPIAKLPLDAATLLSDPIQCNVMPTVPGGGDEFDSEFTEPSL